MSHSFIFDAAQFNRLFPFYLLINKQLEIVGAGRSVTRFCAVQPGDAFAGSFVIPRPLTPEFCFDTLRQLQNQLVVLEHRNDKSKMLRGQFEYLAATDELLFIGSPWFASMEQVIENKLQIHDFAPHDPLIDLLHVLKTQEITSDDLKKLVSTINKQKDELKRANKEIRDIALFPMQNPDPLIRINFDGELLVSNPAAAHLNHFEFEGKLISNNEFFGIVARSIDTSNPRWAIEAVSGGRVYSFVCVSMKEHGYINIYGRDITERKQQEEQMRVLSSIAAENAHGVVIADANGAIEWVNKSFLELTGYTFDEIKGKKPGHFLQGPDTDPETVAYLKERIAAGEPFIAEILNYNKQKKPYWLRIQGQALKNAEGQVVKYFAIEEDITAQRQNQQLLKEFESKMRLAMERVGDYVWEHDFKTGVTRFSKQENHFLGVADTSAIDIDAVWWQHIHPEDRPILEAGNELCRSGQTADHTFEYRMIDNSGEVRWVLDRGVVIEKDENGLPLLMLGTHTDITSRKMAEDQLQAQRRFYEDVLNNIPADIAVFDINHVYRFVNPQGIKNPEIRQWIIGKTDEDYLRFRNKPLDMFKHRNEIFDAVLQTKELQFWEEVMPQPDGSSKYILRYLYPVLNANSEVTLVIGYGVDITSRKQTEMALQENEERYRSIIANMNLGLLEIDLNRQVSFVNQSLADMVGIEPEQAIGINVSDFLPPESLELVNRKEKHGINRKNEAFELQVKVNNQLRWWLISSAPRFNESGLFSGTIVICLDINEQKKLEAELRIAREQAEHLASAKQNFLANMSHEIRTPMNAILGMGNQLAKTTLTEKQSFYLNTINTSAENLLVIINDILDLSKIEAGKFTLERIGFEPKKVIVTAMKMLMHKAEEKGIKLTNSFCDERLADVLIGDPFRINQVLLNLISNSVKFTDMGMVDIRCEIIHDTARSQTFRMVVEDTGKGMDKEFIEKLFDKFSQEYDSANRKYGGSGLGMSICKELVQLMGGSIEVTSEKGVGTIVSFDITCSRGTVADLPNEDAFVFAPDFLKGRIILVTDDNEMNRLIASIILRNYGAEIVEASNGEEAVAVLEEANPDLVLMDIQMPVLNGYEATKRIRRLRYTTPIIALTANAIKGENEKCLAAGMNDYICKPFKEENLLKVIASWLKTDQIMNKQDELQGDINATYKVHYDLSALETIARGNSQFIHKMLQLFIDQAPTTVQELKAAYAANELETVKKLAHRLKPSVDNLGIRSIKNEIREIEARAVEYGQSEHLSGLISLLDTVVLKVADELRAYLARHQSA